MHIYAISDIHGHLNEFEAALSLIDLSCDNKLVLLGDYIHGYNPRGVLDKIMALEEKFGKAKVIALMGNHERWVIEGECGIWEDSLPEYIPDDACTKKYINWMRGLKLYYKTDRQVFVHAGVDEEAYDLWELGTMDYIFTDKMPPDLGEFCTDVIAGHVGTYGIAGDPDFHGVYFDGKSHYYIDGTVEVSKRLPILKYDTLNGKYFEVGDKGERDVKTYATQSDIEKG